MENQVDQLVSEFQEKVKTAEEQIQSYEEGKVEEFTVVLEYLQALNAIAEHIQVSLGDQIRATYAKAKKVKRDRNMKELGYEPNATP